jgi:cytochrome c oxidase subunit 2
MHHPRHLCPTTRINRRWLCWRLFMLPLLVFLNGCANAPSMLDPKGPAAQSISNLWWLLFWMATGVFIIVMAYLLWALLRRREDEEYSTGEPRWGTRTVLLGGIIGPAIILLVVFGATIWTLRAIASPINSNEVVIHVIGQRWWWEVQYPQQQFATANEIHIPVNQPVRIVLSSPNVIHSFWVPELQGKMDLMPGTVNSMWLEADEPGVYRGECAEFCGVQHARMNFLVIAQPQEEFAAWLGRQQQPAPEPKDSLARLGKEVFFNADCMQCHAIKGTDAVGQLGPDLTHIASRRTLASAVIDNNLGNLGGWITDPQHIKPGNLMPPADITSVELQALLAYLATLE